MMQAPPSRPPYLFFSPKCPHCQQLIEMIKKNQPLAKKIEPINVHTARSLPPQLDGVPAILFGGQLLVGPDTFKWVQFQTPQRNDRDRDRDRDQGGMPGGGNMPGMQGRQQQQEEGGQIPMPSDISSDTKHGIEYTPLPGQDSVKIDPTLPRFSFLPGEGNQSDGTVGIDYVAAMDVDTMGRPNKADGISHQLERLQQMRGMDSERIAEQANNNMMYMQGGPGIGGGMGQQGPGFAGPMGSPMGGMSSQMQMNQGGYNQGGYNQGMGQQGYIPPMQGQQGYDRMQGQGGQNPYELQAGARGGYSTQYQQQNNPYRGDDNLPKRF